MRGTFCCFKPPEPLEVPRREEGGAMPSASASSPAPSLPRYGEADIIARAKTSIAQAADSTEYHDALVDVVNDVKTAGNLGELRAIFSQESRAAIGNHYVMGELLERRKGDLYQQIPASGHDAPQGYQEFVGHAKERINPTTNSDDYAFVLQKIAKATDAMPLGSKLIQLRDVADTERNIVRGHNYFSGVFLDERRNNLLSRLP